MAIKGMKINRAKLLSQGPVRISAIS